MTRSISVTGFQKIGRTFLKDAPNDSRSISASSGLAATLNGEANAVGDNTFVDSDLFCRAFDRGAVQITFGSAQFTAAAQSQSGGIAYASVNSYVDIAGADLLASKTTRWSGSGEHGGQSWSTEALHTSFVALNIVGWNIPLGCSHTSDDIGLNGPQHAPSINGNLASFAIDAKAYGDNSFVSVDHMSIATEGFSANTSVVTTAVGSSGTGAAPILRGSSSDLVMTTGADTFVQAGGGNDLIMAAKGDDWIFGGDGKDAIFTGRGNNTVLAGAHDDAVSAQDGDDWIFGGSGRDILKAGDGSNIVDGGAGNDVIFCGKGDDIISGGSGNDVIHAGGGRNIIQLGTDSSSDGNDFVAMGSGRDLLFLCGNFGRDMIEGFHIGQGDRLLAEGGSWNIDDALEALDQGVITLTRAKFDTRDLVITFHNGASDSALTFDNFFQLNSQYGKATSRSPLTDAQASAIVHDIFVDGSADPATMARLDYFAISEYLSLLG